MYKFLGDRGFPGMPGLCLFVSFNLSLNNNKKYLWIGFSLKDGTDGGSPGQQGPSVSLEKEIINLYLHDSVFFL